MMCIRLIRSTLCGRGRWRRYMWTAVQYSRSLVLETEIITFLATPRLPCICRLVLLGLVLLGPVLPHCLGLAWLGSSFHQWPSDDYLTTPYLIHLTFPLYRSRIEVPVPWEQRCKDAKIQPMTAAWLVTKEATVHSKSV